MAHYHPRARRANPLANLARINYPAVALAAMFAGGTAYVLFEDVLRHNAAFTTAHVQTVLALIGTVAAGHFCLPELSARRWLSAAGCALLFVAGTFYIATASGARNATADSAKAAEADKVNDKRAAAREQAEAAQQELADAKAAHKIATAAASKGCADGDGPVCKGKTKTANAAAVELDKAKGYAILMQAKLDVIEPEADRSHGYAHAGAVFAALPYVTASASEITARLGLVMPAVLVFIAEIGLLLFGAMALRLSGPTPAETAQTSFAAPSAAEIEMLTGDWPQPPKPGSRAKPNDRARVVENFVAGYRARHGRDPEPREVRAATNLPRSTAHRYQRRIA